MTFFSESAGLSNQWYCPVIGSSQTEHLSAAWAQASEIPPSNKEMAKSRRTMVFIPQFYYRQDTKGYVASSFSGQLLSMAQAEQWVATFGVRRLVAAFPRRLVAVELESVSD